VPHEKPGQCPGFFMSDVYQLSVFFSADSNSFKR
jgi:hypothetical protein